MKTKKLWNKLKNYLVNNQKYQPDIKIINVYNSETKEDNIIEYQVDEFIIKQSNKQLNPQKEQLNQVNNNDIDNTGSYYWPSEQILTFYLQQNLIILENKKIIELGAGRSGFCGIYLAKKGYDVQITDGNDQIISELENNIALNNLNIPINILKWGSGENFQNTIGLISDCFFFENFHNDLLKMIKRFDKCIGAAPSRGGSLERFIYLCENNGIKCVMLKENIFDTKIILFIHQ